MTRTSVRGLLQKMMAWILICVLLPAQGLAQDRTAQNPPPPNPDYVEDVANFHKAFQDVHRAKARQLEGPQTVDGMAYNSDTIARALATRDVYVAQLQGFISQSSDFAVAKPEIQTPRIKDLIRISAGIGVAEEVRQQALMSRAAGASNGYIPPLRYSGLALHAADQANKFDAKEAAWWRSFSEQPEDQQSALLSQHILSLYDQDPLLGVIDSGFFTSQNLAGAIRSVAGPNGNAPGATDAVRRELPKFIDLALRQSHDEINRVNGFSQYGEFVEFFKPQYVRARAFAADLWGPGEQTHFEEFSRFYNTNLGAESEVKHLTLAMVVGGIAVVTMIVPPLGGLVLSSAGLPTAQVTSVVLTGEALGSGLNATTMAFQWAWDGKEYLAVADELGHGQNGAAVLGQSNLAGLKEKASAAGGQLLLDTVFGVISARDFKLALDRATAARALTVGSNLNAGVRGGGSIGPGGAKVPGASADVLLPAGARPIEETLTAAETRAVLGKIDTEALKSPLRPSEPDTAAFLAAKLPPQKAITTAGQTFYLSAPFEGPGGRTAIVAFQQTPQGTVIPRTFYFSNEHGVWRSATGYRPGGERTGTPGYLLPNIQKGPSAASGRYLNEGSADVIAELQGPLSRHVTESGKTSFVKLSKEETERAFRGHLETTNKDAPEFAQYTRASDVQVPPTGDWRPNMTKGYLDRWTMKSGLYGKLEGFLYPSQDGNAFVVVIRDEEGRVYVGSLQDAWAGVTPFGTRWSTFDTGKLTATPMSHKPRGAAGPEYQPNPDYNPAKFADIEKNLPAPQASGSPAGPANFGASSSSGGPAGTPGPGPNPRAQRTRTGPGETQILTPEENPYAQGVNLNPRTGAAKTQPGVKPLTPDLDPGTMQMTPVPYKEHRVRRPADPPGKPIPAGSIPQENRNSSDASNADRPTRLAQDRPRLPNGSGPFNSAGNGNKTTGSDTPGAASKDKPDANPVDSGLGPNEPLGSEYDRPASPGAANPTGSGLGPTAALGSTATHDLAPSEMEHTPISDLTDGDLKQIADAGLLWLSPKRQQEVTDEINRRQAQQSQPGYSSNGGSDFYPSPETVQAGKSVEAAAESEITGASQWPSTRDASGTTTFTSPDRQRIITVVKVGSGWVVYRFVRTHADLTKDLMNRPLGEEPQPSEKTQGDEKTPPQQGGSNPPQRARSESNVTPVPQKGGEKKDAKPDKLYDDNKSPQTPPAGAPEKPAGTPGGANGAQAQGVNDIPLPPLGTPHFTNGVPDSTNGRTTIYKDFPGSLDPSYHLYTNPDTGRQSWVHAGGKTNPPGEPIGWWGQDPQTGEVTWHPRQFPPPLPPGKWVADPNDTYHFVQTMQLPPNSSRQIRLRVENKCPKRETFQIRSEGLPANLVQPSEEISIEANDTHHFLLTINSYGLDQGKYDGNLVVVCTSCAASACRQLRSVFPQPFLVTQAPDSGVSREPVNSSERPQSDGMGNSAPNSPTEGTTQQNRGAEDSAQPAEESPL